MKTHPGSRGLERYVPFAAFLLLDAFSLRNALTTPGMVGHVWDWAVPALPEQNLQQALSIFWSWDNWLNGGSFNPLKSLYYFFFTFPLGTFGGEVESKALVFLLPLCSAVGMYLLARRGLRLNRFWATVAGGLYMLSPITYSRLISGYLSLIVAHALIPVLVLACLAIPRSIERQSRSLPWLVVATGFLLGVCQALHSSIFAIASFTAAVVIGMELRRSNAKRLIGAAAAVFALGLLLNISWLTSFGISYFSSGSLFHGGTTSKPTDLITLASVTDWRQNLLDSVSQPMYESIRSNSINGVATEIQYPIPDGVGGIWAFGSFVIPLAVFSLLLRRRAPSRLVLALMILGLVGVAIVSGTRTAAGSIILQFLKSYVPPVWAEFGSTPRALPLVVLSYCALAPLSFECLSGMFADRARSTRWSFHLERNTGAAVGALGVVTFVVWSVPFLSGNITQTTDEAIGLHFYSFDSEDRALYSYLRNNPSDSRMLVIPPPGIWGTTDYDWVWGVGNLPARPKFMAPSFNSLAWRAASDLSQFSPNSRAGKLLGLAAVQNIVYPFAKFFQGAPGTTFDAVLAAQPDFKRLDVPFVENRVFENQSSQPRLYAAPTATAVLASSDLLPPLSTTPFVGDSPALFFSTQQTDAGLASVISHSAQTIAPIQTYAVSTSAVVTTTLGFDTQPISAETRPVSNTADAAQVLSLGETVTSAAGTFSAPRAAAYVVRASAYAPTGSQTVDGQPAFSRLQDDLTYPFSLPDWNTSMFSEKSKGLEWSSNTLFDERAASGRELDVRVLFTDSSLDNPYVEFTEPVKPFSLNDYPLLQLSAQAQDPGVQLVETWLGLDWNGDGLADDNWSLPIAPGVQPKSDQFAIRDFVKQDYPDKPDYRVVSVTIKLTRRPKLDPSRIVPGVFEFILQDISFRSGGQPAKVVSVLPPESGSIAQVAAPGCGCTQGKSGQGLAFAFPAGSGGMVAVLRRPLADLDPRSDTIYSVAYYVDGPGATDLDIVLSGVDANGASQFVPLGTQLLEPFSHGTLVFFAPHTDLKYGQVIMALGKLVGQSELRDTDVALTQFRVSRSVLVPYKELNPPAPEVTIDGQPVELSAETANIDRSGSWFESASLELSGGIHRISAGYDDPTSPYRMGLVEIDPVEAEPNAVGPAAPAVNFREINPTRFLVHVENAAAPFFLVFGESYHTGWEAFAAPGLDTRDSTWYEQSALASWILDGGARAEISEHNLVNGFANSWYVDRKGSYNIILEFAPQRLYEAGVLVSIMTPILGFVALSAFWFHRHRGI